MRRCNVPIEVEPTTPASFAADVQRSKAVPPARESLAFVAPGADVVPPGPHPGTSDEELRRLGETWAALVNAWREQAVEFDPLRRMLCCRGKTPSPEWLLAF